jgi:hypothetical protein
MNHNPNNVIVGQSAILDLERSNRSKVEVKHITIHGMFAAVTDGKNTWAVMTKRLTPITTFKSYVPKRISKSKDYARNGRYSFGVLPQNNDNAVLCKHCSLPYGKHECGGFLTCQLFTGHGWIYPSSIDCPERKSYKDSNYGR